MPATKVRIVYVTYKFKDKKILNKLKFESSTDVNINFILSGSNY